MTGPALSDRDMFLVRDIVASCSNVSGDVELLPWQLGEELFSLIECDSLVAWRGGPADLMPQGPDFSERDRVLLSLLRPHLHAALVATERRRLGVAPLTTRQREILQYVAAGMGNRQIARRLGLSD